MIFEGVIFLYLLSFLVVIWNYGGYLIFLRKNVWKDPNLPHVGPQFISILIPFLNEEPFIRAKVKNLIEELPSNLDYEVIFIDGGSTDKSIEILEQSIESKTGWRLLVCSKAGKIHQLNFALEHLDPRTSIVVNTDMDSLLRKGALGEILDVLQTHKNVGAVGAMVTPMGPLQIEKKFWEDQNFIREIEGAYYSTTSIVAPLYAFRKSLISSFPKDCIADDVYVTFYCNTLGWRVLMSSAQATEVRGPTTFYQFMLHKYRKAFANMRETYRFAKSANKGPLRWRFLFWNRFSQLVLAPFALVMLMILSLIFLMDENVYMKLFVLSFFLIALAIALPIQAWRQRANSSPGILLTLVSIFLTNIILIAVHLSYPFIQQDSSYRKIR